MRQGEGEHLGCSERPTEVLAAPRPASYWTSTYVKTSTATRTGNDTNHTVPATKLVQVNIGTRSTVMPAVRRVSTVVSRQTVATTSAATVPEADRPEQDAVGVGAEPWWSPSMK